MTVIQQWLAAVRDVPRIECEVLLCETLDLSRAQILAFPERQLAPSEQSSLNLNIAALRSGTPLAYILGYREFWGLRFKVTPAVLIPRPETELLVELAVELAPANGQVLDLGTGSGAIAVAVAHERPDLTVTAVDSSDAALSVAAENANAHRTEIDFVSGDWFSKLSGKWHVAVANPPYIAPDDPHLPALQAEPQSALVAAENGLADIQRIIHNAGRYLHTSGHLLIEHGYNQADAVRGAMRQAGFANVCSKQDLGAIERVTIGRMDNSQTGISR